MQRRVGAVPVRFDPHPASRSCQAGQAAARRGEKLGTKRRVGTGENAQRQRATRSAREERQFRDLEVSYKQLSFLLERLNSYNTQATLVTGFAFTAFSADALQALPYEDSPIRAYLFCFFCSLAMAAAIAAVVLSSYLMARSERLAMNSSVEMAVAATRLRTPRVKWLYTISRVGLVGAACSSSSRRAAGRRHCNGVGWMSSESSSSIAICTACICRVAQDFDQAAEVSARVGSECRDVLLESDAAAGPSSGSSSRDASIRASSARIDPR